jgi:hypothetical protein
LTAIHTDLGAIFVSLELSRSSWLITSLSPGGGEKMSKHSVRGGDFAGLMERFAQLQEKARLRTGQSFRIIVIQEAGLDGFWIHRALQNEGIESHVVDAASIATSRRRRRAKTDKIDGETLVRALLAYKRGEPRVCAMVKVRRGDQDARLYCLTGECSQDVERCLTAGVPVASLISRPSHSSLFNSKSMLTDVGPVELWATRQRRPSAAANPQGSSRRLHNC